MHLNPSNMRNSILTMFVILLLNCLLNAQPNFSFFPLKPQPGDLIKIEYTPAGDIANTRGKVEGLMYRSNTRGRTADDLLLTKIGKKYTATIQTDTSHNFIQLGFYVEDKFDNNFNDGYFIQLYEGEKVKKESNLNLEIFYSFYGRETGIDTNNEKAFAAINDEIALYPEQNKKVAHFYYRLLRIVKPNEAQAQIQEAVEALLKEGLKSEADYDQVVSLYNAAQLREQALFFEGLRNGKFPQGRWVVNDFIMKHLAQNDAAKKSNDVC